MKKIILAIALMMTVVILPVSADTDDFENSWNHQGLCSHPGMDIQSRTLCGRLSSYAMFNNATDSLVYGPVTQSSPVEFWGHYNGGGTRDLKLCKSANPNGPWAEVQVFSLSSSCQTYASTTSINQNYYFLLVRDGSNNEIFIDDVTVTGALPVELVNFSASRVGNNVLLKWKTATEVNNYGFEVEKSTDSKNFTKIGFVPGAGTSSVPREYKFSDNFDSGELMYRLKQVDRDGSHEYSPMIKVAKSGTLNKVQILGAFPNPFNPQTTISYALPETRQVKLIVCDAEGRIVATLFEGQQEAGSHSQVFKATGLESGAYFIHLQGGTERQVQQIILTK